MTRAFCFAKILTLNDNMTMVDGAFLGSAVGFRSGTCWSVGAGGIWRWGSVFGCALGWAGWGHLRLHWNVSVGFGASGWLVFGCSWAWGSFTVFWVLLVISCSDVRWVGASGMPQAGLII